MTAPQPANKVRPSYASNAMFHLSGFLLNQIVKDSELSVIRRDNGARLRAGKGAAKFAIEVDDADTIWKIISNPDPGAGELYMDGKWEMMEGDIGAFITMMARNFQNLLASPVNFILSSILKKKLQPRKRDAENSKDYVQHHYDIGNDLYELFLDEGMNYSCAFFDNSAMSLRDAQLNKIRTVIKRLGIPQGAHVLDVGCGWGEAARTVANETAASVTGITLAANQLDLAKTRAQGMNNAPTFLLEDYREHAAKHPGGYDRIYSIGMFEHVGEDAYDQYFAAIKQQLAPGGKALIHSIVNASRESENLMNSPWLEKYIFPGGRIPDLPEMIDAADKQELRPAIAPYLQPPSDYAETLRRWRKNFVRNADKLDPKKYDARFKRMWVYYLAMSEAMFDGIGCQIAQVVFEAKN